MDSTVNVDEWVADLSRPENGARLTKVAEDFARHLAGEVDPLQAHGALAPEIRENESFQKLLAGFAEHYHDKIEGEPAQRIAASFLIIAAEDPALRPALSDFLASYEDTTQFTGLEILAAGAAISMILIAATTSFEGKIGTITVRKQVATKEQIEAAGSWAVALARALGL